MAATGIDSLRYTRSASAALFLVLCLASMCNSNHDARRLYDDLLRKNRYNRLIRPVGNSTDKLTVKMGLKLAQVLDVNERTQVITTNLWVVQEWKDDGLQWDPVEYGGVKTLYVPSESIWLPDIVLYNNADGDYTVTIMTKATLSYYGTVHWEPPVIFKSHCEIEVEFFPFDIQHCHMKFGSWSYDGFQVDLVHIWQEMLGVGELALIDLAVDLSDFYRSVEWDLLSAPAKKNIVRYPCCAEPYLDITFNLTLRRKTLFYTINLLIPCISINALTILGFYLPSDAGEKISLCISILLSLSIFQLLLMEIVPATSLTIPLMGKYILFTSILLSISIFSSVITLNVNFRSRSKPTMPRATRRIFLEILPRLLCMHRLDISSEEDPDEDDGFDWSTAHSELPDVNSLYKSTYHVAPNTASTSPGQNTACTSSGQTMASTSSGHNMASTSSVHNMMSTSSGHNMASTSSGHNMTSTSSGHNMASTSSGHNMASTSSGHNMTSTSSGHNMTSTSSGHNMASTSSGHNMTSTSSGHNMASTSSGHNMASTSSGHNMASTFVGMQGRGVNMSSFCDACADRRHNHMPPNARKALEGATFIAKHLGAENDSKQIRDEWKYVALVIDRILLIVYVTVCVLGGLGILLRAPALYDYRMPLTRNSYM